MRTGPSGRSERVARLLRQRTCRAPAAMRRTRHDQGSSSAEAGAHCCAVPAPATSAAPMVRDAAALCFRRCWSSRLGPTAELGREGLMSGKVEHVGREVRNAVAGKLGLSRDGSEDFMELANPWGSMPSDAIPAAAVTARSLAQISPAAGAVAWGCTGLLAFTVVYLGEHYVTDVIAGLALTEAVCRPSPRCCHSSASAARFARTRAPDQLKHVLAARARSQACPAPRQARHRPPAAPDRRGRRRAGTPACAVAARPQSARRATAAGAAS